MIGAWGFDKLVSGGGDKLLGKYQDFAGKYSNSGQKSTAQVHRAHSKVERSNVSKKSGDAVQTAGMPSSHRGGTGGGEAGLKKVSVEVISLQHNAASNHSDICTNYCHLCHLGQHKA